MSFYRHGALTVNTLQHHVPVQGHRKQYGQYHLALAVLLFIVFSFFEGGLHVIEYRC